MVWMKLSTRLDNKFCLTAANFIFLSFALQFEITRGTVRGIFKGVTTVELDNLAAEISASLTTVHPDYAKLAARIAISNLQKETRKVLYIDG